MIAGRGLAFTGGTIDKLESIPNFQTNLSLNKFINQVNAIGCCIASQSAEICPADKKLYSIRDLTGTIPSLPLICSSIMSKKIAEGLNGLVIDLKIGNGTFMKTLKNAKELAKGLKKIGKAFNINTEILYTNMDQPLGKYAGLHCEIIEAMDCLKGNGPKDLMEITFELGSKILLQSNIVKSNQTAKKLMLESINNENALKLIVDAIKKSGFENGKDISICLDVAANELYHNKKYSIHSKSLISVDKSINQYKGLINKYKIKSIEDPFAENDWNSWNKLIRELDKKIQIVGDDLFVTNLERLKIGFLNNSANSILIKLNQIGTVTETLEVIKFAKLIGFNTIISHRSGDSEDTFIADLAVGTDSNQIKTGSLARSERVSKYNQLLRIEEQLGKSSKMNNIT